MKDTVWGPKRKKTAPTLKEPTVGRETWQVHRTSRGKQPCNHCREVLGDRPSWARKGSICASEPCWMHLISVGWKPGGEQRRHQPGVWGQVQFGRDLAMEVEGVRQRGCWGLWHPLRHLYLREQEVGSHSHSWAGEWLNRYCSSVCDERRGQGKGTRWEGWEACQK